MELVWNSVIFDLAAGAQHTPSYLALNPNAVVPTLDHDGFIARESSLIIQYLDSVADKPDLMPADARRAYVLSLWLQRTLDIHAAVNALSFATLMHVNDVKLTEAQCEEKWAKLSDPVVRTKRRDIFASGLDSVHVASAARGLDRAFADMQAQLADGKWLLDGCSLADTGLISYVDRLDRLAMSAFRDGRYDPVTRWRDAGRIHPSYDTAIVRWIDDKTAARYKEAGSDVWGHLKRYVTA